MSYPRAVATASWESRSNECSMPEVPSCNTTTRAVICQVMTSLFLVVFLVYSLVWYIKHINPGWFSDREGGRNEFTSSSPGSTTEKNQSLRQVAFFHPFLVFISFLVSWESRQPGRKQLLYNTIIKGVDSKIDNDMQEYMTAFLSSHLLTWVLFIFQSLRESSSSVAPILDGSRFWLKRA